MIKNGFYYPDKIFEKLLHENYLQNKIDGSAAIAICLGNRTAGKTVGFCIELIRRYVLNKERCLVLCRTDKEKIKGYLRRFWQKTLVIDDAEGIIPQFREGHKLTFTRDALFVDGDVFCYCEAISQSAAVKNTGSFDNCRYIVMDEAIQKDEYYLNIEGLPALTRIFEIWQTVARGRADAEKTTNLIFIANVDKAINWLTIDLKLSELIDNDTKFTCQRSIVYEKIVNENAIKKITTAGMGQIMQNSISGEDYFASNVKNEYQDNKSFIEKKPLDFKMLRAQLFSPMGYLGVFELGGRLHLAKIREDTRSIVIVNNINLHKDNKKYVYQHNGKWEQMLTNLYKDSKLTFNDQESKTMFLHFCGYA